MAVELKDRVVTPSEGEVLFPAFARFVEETPKLLAEKGSLSAKLPRILGQGKTRASGLDLPPAKIERMAEYASLVLPSEFKAPDAVVSEMVEVRTELDRIHEKISKPESIRRLAVESIRSLLDVQSGLKDNYYFAGRLILRWSKNGREWSWCLTPDYPIIPKIPADRFYIIEAFKSAEALLQRLVLKPEEFDLKLRLAWFMARQFSNNDDVLLVDVARMFKVAQQNEKFWRSPQKQFFVDVPDAAFIANLLNWRARTGGGSTEYEFVPATLNQSHGPQAKAYYVPVNREGTQVRPYIYIRMKNR